MNQPISPGVGTSRGIATSEFWLHAATMALGGVLATVPHASDYGQIATVVLKAVGSIITIISAGWYSNNRRLMKLALLDQQAQAVVNALIPPSPTPATTPHDAIPQE